jgi:hypothetical protein
MDIAKNAIGVLCRDIDIKHKSMFGYKLKINKRISETLLSEIYRSI